MKKLALISVALAAALGTCAAFAQMGGGRPVRIIVPVPPGGPTDFATRIVAPKLSEALQQNVVVDNRPSANGVLGGELAARAAPDGYTLLMGNSGTNAINAALYRKLPYNPEIDFAPVIEVLTSPLVLVANPRVPVATLKDLVALAKKDPGKINVAVAGATGEIAGEALMAQTGMKLNNVRYKGSSPAEVAVLSNESQVTYLTPIASMNHVNSGRMKALGVSGTGRLALLPNVPTIAEQGVEGYDYQIWHGLFAPKGTPDRMIGDYHREVTKILAQPELRERVGAQGFEVVPGSPGDFAAFVKREIAKYRKVVAEAGIALE